MGGAVGEVHGAKLVGLLRRARARAPARRPAPARLGRRAAAGGERRARRRLRGDAGGARDARAGGIPVVALVGGGWGCFGGMGIVARCCDAIAMSEEGRLGLSGPGRHRGDEGRRGARRRGPRPRLAHLRREAPLPPRRGRPARGRRRSPRSAAAAQRAARAPRGRSTLATLEQEHARLARRLAAPAAAPTRPSSGAPPARRIPDAAPAPRSGRVPQRRRRCRAGGSRERRRSCSTSLFPDGHAVREEAGLVLGGARATPGEVAVIGIAGGAEVGVEAAHALAGEVLRVVRERPGGPIVAARRHARPADEPARRGARAERLPRPPRRLRRARRAGAATGSSRSCTATR